MATMQFTSTNHLVSQDRTFARPTPGVQVLVDGKPYIRADYIKVNVAPVGNIFASIVHVNAPGPGGLGTCGAIAQVRDGILQGVFAVTHAGQDEKGLVIQLREKYGKPTSTRVIHLQNGYGAKIDLEEMEWVLPGLRVAFKPMEGGIATGSVRVETETGYQARLAEKKHIEASKPKL